MKPQAFILKNKYQEHYLLEEWQSHKKRLNELKSSSVSIRQDFDNSVVVQRKRQNQASLQFLTSRKTTEIDSGNEIIGKKLDKIYFPHGTTKKSNKARRAKSSQETAGPSLHEQFLRDKERQQKQIDHENEILAYKLLNLEPTVYPKKKLDRQYSQHKQLKKRVKKYHVLRPYGDYDPSSDEDEDLFDMTNPELLKERIHLYINLKRFDASVLFKGKGDRFMLEIKGREGMRRTQPELLDDFHKSVLNEYFTFEELRENAMLHVGIHVAHGDEEPKPLGDFEIDLRRYYIESGIYDIEFDLRNQQSPQQKQKHYYAPDFRRNGHIVFQLRVKSSLKKYLLDQLPEGMTFDEYRKHRRSVMAQGRGSIMARGSILGGGQLIGGNRHSVRAARPSIMFKDLQEPPKVTSKVEYHGRLSRLGPAMLQFNNNQKTKVQKRHHTQM